MNGQGKLLTHFLKNADKLVIPVYQRNYDWKEEHCKKLYSDLVKTVREGKRWHFFGPDVKFCVSVFRQKSRMAQESRADSGLNPLVTENHSGQNGMRAAPA